MGKATHIEQDRAAAIDWAISRASDSDIVLIAGKQLGWETSGDAFLVAAACASLTAVISLGAIMLKVARPYVVAFVATLAFFGVLEILTWIPAIEQQLIPYLS